MVQPFRNKFGRTTSAAIEVEVEVSVEAEAGAGAGAGAEVEAAIAVLINTSVMVDGPNRELRVVSIDGIRTHTAPLSNPVASSCP